MSRTKTREIKIIESKGTFSIFKKQNLKREDFNFEGIHALRQLLTPEKARIIHTIKELNPNSRYDLAKKLGRGFKAVNDDLKLLERFGFIDFIEEKTKNRIRHRPEVVVDSININIRL